MEDMGMTNEQYKGMLLDELEDWQCVGKTKKNKKMQKFLKKGLHSEKKCATITLLFG